MPKNSAESESRLVWRVVDGEALIVDLTSGAFFSLDRVGTEIWIALKNGSDRAQIVATITAKYGVDEQTVQRDVAELLDELSREGLVE